MLTGVCKQDRLAPWSMAVEALRHAAAMKQLTLAQYQQRCASTPAELLSSVQSGERICTLRLFTPEQTCTILNKYSQIFWIGNSLTRHTLIGLLNLVSSNLRTTHKYTSNPRYPQFETKAKEALLSCQCDGQYSVHPACVAIYRQADLQEGIMNACADVLGESFGGKAFQFQYLQAFQLNQLHVSRCSAVSAVDTRPLFLYVQGGNVDAPVKDINPRHMNGQRQPQDFNIPSFFKHTLSTFIHQYEKFYQHCPNGKQTPLHIAFSGVNAQNQHPEDQDASSSTNHASYSSARGYDNKRMVGGSSTADLLALNTRLLEYIDKWHPQVYAVNFFNLTMAPTADSADGYHYLTSTNIQKAMTLLRLMDMVAAAE